jgi:transcription antitermination factor NusG
VSEVSVLDWSVPAARPGYTEERLHWYAVHTRSNFERRVARELCSKRLESFLPEVEEVHQWKDRKKRVALPLFPGYVFVRMASSDEARLKVLQTNGTVRILGYGPELEPIPDQEISAIRTLIASNVPFLTQPFLREGAWVRVVRGPLRDVEGVLLHVKKQTRLVVSINLLSRSISTEIDIRDAEAVRRPEARIPRREHYMTAS